MPMVRCSRCGYNSSVEFEECPKCGANKEQSSEAAEQKRRTRHKVLNVVDWALRITAISVILAFLVLPFLGVFVEQRDQMLEFMMAGLDHYKEIPEYAVHDVDRFVSITGPGYAVSYTIKITKPYNISMKLKDSSGKYPVQEVTYSIFADPTIKVVNTETQVAAQGGKPCVIIDNDPDAKEIYLRGYNLTTQTHNFKIQYHIKVTSIDWALTPDECGVLSDIPSDVRNKFSRSEWLVGDLNQDEDMDLVDEDLNKNAKLDFGEDEDGDGNIDVNEDMNHDGYWDYRIDPGNKTIANDPLILKAQALKGSETNVLKIIQSFYDYLQEEFTYPTAEQMAYDSYMYAGKPKSALRTMQDHYGDCDDQSIVLISLCRSVGIPAWLECGALFDPTLKVWQAHGWANVYIPLKGGGVAKATIDAVNDEYLLRDSNRFTEWMDDSGTQGDIEKYYTSFSYHYGSGTSTGKTPLYQDEYQYLSFQAHQSEMKIKV